MACVDSVRGWECSIGAKYPLGVYKNRPAFLIRSASEFIFSSSPAGAPPPTRTATAGLSMVAASSCSGAPRRLHTHSRARLSEGAQACYLDSLSTPTTMLNVFELAYFDS
ncbi:hypothetical protein BS78_K338300 [Paspalum vaginatum]|uniref:Uncharacterized protein n=1 Tax=Paspalum vaginatum TaxID=158149 RepID=A0A9W7XDN9_9POAL|nr:hypothetical protein BS78_K338300 [Paspalum vaginatum]